jgi:hypothetical protein
MAVCYVADAIIISEDEDNLQRSLHRLEKYNVHVCSRNLITRQGMEAVYNKSIDQVMIFKYLTSQATEI